MRIVFILLFVLSSCNSSKEYVIKQDQSQVQEKFKLIEGSFWTKSKAHTELEIKTVFRIEVDTGKTYYLRDGVWYVALDFMDAVDSGIVKLGQ